MNLIIKSLNHDTLKSNEISLFFKNYPFEVFYRLNLKLDESVFIKFLVHKLENRLKSESNIWEIRKDQELVAIFGLDKDKTTSTKYGKEIYFTNSFYNFSVYNSEAFKLINEQIHDFAQEKKIDIVKCKIDAEDHSNISMLLSEHFHYYASSCKIYYDVETLGVPRPFVKHRYSVRQYRTEDLPAVIAILKQHTKNEKYYNSDLDKEKTREIFEEYFLGRTASNKSTVLVLEDLMEKKVLGLSVYSTPESFNESVNKKLVTWDLIVIDESARGNGLGHLFFSQMVNYKKADIELSTMSDNFQMQKFLHKFGFYKVGEFNHLYKKFHH